MLVPRSPQARLAKNYGIGRMDPYVRLSVGQDRQCSQVCVNGAKTPFWNSSVTINLPDIADFSLKVEVLSQGTFSDRLVGWTEIPILEAYQGRRIEAWHHLTGKQGKDKEGVINLAVSFQVKKEADPLPPQNVQRAVARGMVRPCESNCDAAVNTASLTPRHARAPLPFTHLLLLLLRGSAALCAANRVLVPTSSGDSEWL